MASAKNAGVVGIDGVAGGDADAVDLLVFMRSPVVLLGPFDDAAGERFGSSDHGLARSRGRHDDTELIASDAGGAVDHAGFFLEDLGESGEHAVACKVAVLVVGVFEAVEVKKKHCQGRSLDGLRALGDENAVEVTTVPQTAERVGEDVPVDLGDCGNDAGEETLSRNGTVERGLVEEDPEA